MGQSHIVGHYYRNRSISKKDEDVEADYKQTLEFKANYAVI